MAVNHVALMLLAGRVQHDLAAAESAVLISIGDALGLYRALAERSMNAVELAGATETDPRYVASWLINQAAGGYVTFDRPSGTYSLNEEQRAILTGADDPWFALPGFQMAAALASMRDAVIEVFRGQKGIDAAQYPQPVHQAMRRMARARATGLATLLTETQYVREGDRVLDVGCGGGEMLVALAKSAPTISGIGVDLDAAAIADARALAAAERVDGRIEFRAGSVLELAEAGIDLAVCVDSLHELPAPVGCAGAIRRSLAEGGRLVVIEASAGGSVEANMNAAGRLYSATDVLFCRPTSDFNGGGAVGIVGGERPLRAILEEAGFSSVSSREHQRFMVLEARA